MAAKEQTGKNKDKDLVLGCKNYSLRKAAQLNKLQDIWGRPFMGKSDKAMDCYMGGFISILSSFKRFYSFVFMYCMASLGEKLTI